MCDSKKLPKKSTSDFFFSVLFIISDSRTSKQLVTRTLHLLVWTQYYCHGDYCCGNLQGITGRHHAVNQGPAGKKHPGILLYDSEPADVQVITFRPFSLGR